MSDELLEDEVSETFTLIEPPKRIELSDLPLSPRKALKAATACGWEVRAWLAIGEVAPTLYLHNSDEDAKKPHSAGDVLYDGYRARLFTVEARVADLPLGFRAHYVGKQYDDGRAASAGGFDHALVVDPVGVPRSLSARYKPISQQRGKFETAKSFQRREDDAKTHADEMAVSYNDGGVVFQHSAMFDVSKEFDAWLAEWRSFSPTTEKATTK